MAEKQDRDILIKLIYHMFNRLLYNLKFEIDKWERFLEFLFFETCPFSVISILLWNVQTSVYQTNC